MQKIELNIPESLNDITLEQYQKFIEIEEPNNDDLLKTFLNIDTRILKHIRANEIEKLCITINELFKCEKTFVNRFRLNGIEYGFIPNLDEISYGEYRDVSSYLGEWSQMHKAMAVLYRPIKQKQGKKYLIADYEGTHEYSETMKQMPLDVVFGANVFFYNLMKDLLQVIPSYLQKVMKQEQMSDQVLVENGVDFKKLTHLLKATLDDMTKLLDYHYTSVSSN
jgi:hypothetical protein